MFLLTTGCSTSSSTGPPLALAPNTTNATSNGAGNGTAVREINYAELDLPKSNAIGFNQVQRKSRTNGSSVSNLLPYIYPTVVLALFQ